MDIRGAGASGLIQQAQQRFQRADADADGAISRAEFDAVAANAPGGRSLSADEAFAKFDSNRDGALSTAELRSGVQSTVTDALKSRGVAGAGFPAVTGVGGQDNLLASLMEVDETDASDPKDEAAQQSAQPASEGGLARGVSQLLDRFDAVV